MPARFFFSLMTADGISARKWITPSCSECAAEKNGVRYAEVVDEKGDHIASGMGQAAEALADMFFYLLPPDQPVLPLQLTAPSLRDGETGPLAADALPVSPNNAHQRRPESPCLAHRQLGDGLDRVREGDLDLEVADAAPGHGDADGADRLY
jgi:hypothetical protein